MKKIISILTILIVLTSFTLTSKAEKIGDTIGMVYHTDIVAYINNYAVPSYAANGTSVIVAEDLRNFGFNVTWDEVSRSLNITRNESPMPNEMQVVKNGKPSNGFTYMLYTDIKVFADGIQIPSYAIQGYTMIPVESLTMFGECRWISEERALKLWIDGLHIREQMQSVYQYPFEEKMILDEDGNGTAYYDLDFDGNYDKIEMRQSRSYENSYDGTLNTLKTELVINGESLLIDNAYKTHGCGAVYIADIDRLDQALDILVFMSYKSTELLIYQYKNGTLIPSYYKNSSTNDTSQYIPVGDLFEIQQPELLRLHVMHAENESPKFMLTTSENSESYTEAVPDGTILHGTIKEFYYEKYSDNEYITLN